MALGKAALRLGVRLSALRIVFSWTSIPHPREFYRRHRFAPIQHLNH